MAERHGAKQTSDPTDTGHSPGWTVRAMAAVTLVWESLWPLLIPLLLVGLTYAILSWVGVWRILPDALRLAGLAAFGLASLAALWPLREFRLPSRAQVNRRLETASALPHRPLTAQEDAMATGGGDAMARALWQEHRRRMAQRLRDLTAGAPSPRANRFDPWAMRALLAVAAVAAFGFSQGSTGGSVLDPIRQPISGEEIRSRLDVWIDPPAYTRRPPVYLTGAGEGQADREFGIPQGSRLTMRYVGQGTVEARFDSDAQTEIIARQDEEADSAPAAEWTMDITRSGRISVHAGRDEITGWNIEVIEDQPPTIRFAEPPGAALSGSLQLAYEVSDDYGVVSAQTRIESQLERDPQARPLVEAPNAALSLPRKRARSGSAQVNRDLTSHPWAGSKVAITLEATDDAGQTGRSETVSMELPGRNFSNPLARALVEQRRVLALDARKAQRVGDHLDALLTAPEEFIQNAGAVLGITVAMRRIVSAADDDELRSALDLLWETALAIEFGDMSEAERRLREAQEKLSEALENGASDEEIAELMEELREAMEEFMRMLAQEAMENPLSANPFGENEMTQMLRQQDLERMLDQIEDLARSGSRDAARQMLSELQRMMDNLRAGRHMQQRRAEGNQTNQALDKLSELMRQQQQLMDETFRMQQRQRQLQEQQGGQSQERSERDGQQQQPMTPEEFAKALEQLRQRQEALRESLGELGEQLEALGLDPSGEFGEAGREMGEAGENLGRGNTGGAATDQGEALEALRRGAQSMMEQMAGDRQQGGQQMGQGENGGPDRRRADPLGRSRQAEGLETGDETRVPDEIDAQRAREIMEAIRERLGRPAAPLIERNYLERLLESR